MESPLRAGNLLPMAASPRPQHLIRLGDLTRGQLEDLLDLSARLKRRAKKGGSGELAGRTAGLLFFRGSLRTRTSFEAAVNQLGGQVIHLTAASDFWELEEREGAVMDGRAPEHIKDQFHIEISETGQVVSYTDEKIIFVAGR